MPTFLSNLTFIGARIRGLPAPVAADEPVRKQDGTLGGGGGSSMTWRVVTAHADIEYEDAGNAIGVNSATGVNITVPPDSTFDIAIPNGASILLEQRGIGQVTIVAGAGVTIDRRIVFLAKTAGQFSPITLIRKSADHWLLAGDLEVG